MKIIGKPQKDPSQIVAKRDVNGEFGAGIQVVSDMDGFSYDSYNGMVLVDKKPGREAIKLSPMVARLKVTLPKAAAVEKQVVLKRGDRVAVNIYP